jgi:hypothetical protein
MIDIISSVHCAVYTQLPCLAFSSTASGPTKCDIEASSAAACLRQIITLGPDRIAEFDPEVIPTIELTTP